MRATSTFTYSSPRSCATASGSGDLPPGRALPSACNLSQQYEVAIGTVKRAIELLRDEGLVRTVIGRGIFVTRPDGL